MGGTSNLPSWPALFRIISFFYTCTGWRYIVAFTKVLIICQIYHNLIHPLHLSPLSSLHPLLSFNKYHFSFTYMHMQYLHHIHTPSQFSYLLPTPTGTIRTKKDLFCPPILQYYIRTKEEKKWHFLLKTATYGVSLWHFHV
jgi:hypothetical protein